MGLPAEARKSEGWEEEIRTLDMEWTREVGDTLLKNILNQDREDLLLRNISKHLAPLLNIKPNQLLLPKINNRALNY